MPEIEEPRDTNRLDDAAQARRRRQVLGDLAHAQQTAWSDGAPENASAGSHPLLALSGHKPFARVLTLAALITVVVVGIAAGVFVTLRHPARTKPPQAPRLALANLKAAGIACTSDAEWSPDGKRIAVLGYLNDCPNLPFPKAQEPGAISLYTRTANDQLLLKQFPLDDAVLKAIPIPPSVQQAFHSANLTAIVAIAYTHALWSHDGSQIAIVLTAYVPTGLPSSTISASGTAIWPQEPVRGMILLDSKNGQTRVFTAAINKDSPRYTEWDLDTGSPIVPASSMISASDTSTLPPALAYSWGANGILNGEMPLNSIATPPAPPLAPVGNPDGGDDFTLWQPGVAALTIRAPKATIETPGVYTWTTSEFAAWSPDGRYLIDRVELNARVEPAGQPVPAHQTLVDMYADHLPLLPVRDAGLQALLAAMPATAYDPFHQSYEVAWRPDGRMLAAQSRNIPNPDDLSAQGVALYDCASGKLLTVLKPPVEYPFAAGESLLRWSPDGTSLLLLDPHLGVLIMWNSNALPH